VKRREWYLVEALADLPEIRLVGIVLDHQSVKLDFHLFEADLFNGFSKGGGC
jgi:hypothetical protein